MTDWQTLIDEKIKIQLVAHITLAGRSLGTISIDPDQPKNANGYDNLKLELFAGHVSDNELLILHELLERARIGPGLTIASRLRQMELDLAKIRAYKFVLRDL